MGITDKITGRVKMAAGDLMDDPSTRREGAREESDQLPEEAPPSQVPDDDGSGEARDEAGENAGAREGEEGESTGNPANAG